MLHYNEFTRALLSKFGFFCKKYNGNSIENLLLPGYDWLVYKIDASFYAVPNTRRHSHSSISLQKSGTLPHNLKLLQWSGKYVTLS